MSTQKDTWQAFTLKDAYKPRDDVKYIVDGVIEAGSLNIFYGPPGTMKSLLLGDLAVCVASTKYDFLPHMDKLKDSGQPIKVHHCPVMWIDLDNGKRRTHARFEALGHGRQLPEDTQLTYYSMPHPMLDANSDESMEALKARMMQQTTGLLIIDNLGIAKGSAKENDDSMTLVMSRFRLLADETGAAVIIIHHQRKGGKGDGRVGESLRGFSSIEAALDYAFLVERDEDTLKVLSTKTRDDDIVPFGAKFTYKQKENRDLETAIFYGLLVEDKRPEVAVKKAIRKALTPKSDGTIESGLRIAAGERPRINKTQLIKIVNEETKIGKNKVGEIIDNMEAVDELHVTDGARNEKLYSLP